MYILISWLTAMGITCLFLFYTTVKTSKPGFYILICESPYDCYSFFYNPTNMTADEAAKARSWINTVIEKLHEVRPR